MDWRRSDTSAGAVPTRGSVDRLVQTPEVVVYHFYTDNFWRKCDILRHEYVACHSMSYRVMSCPIMSYVSRYVSRVLCPVRAWTRSIGLDYIYVKSYTLRALVLSIDLALDTSL